MDKKRDDYDPLVLHSTTIIRTSKTEQTERIWPTGAVQHGHNSCISLEEKRSPKSIMVLIRSSFITEHLFYRNFYVAFNCYKGGFSGL